jgi:hypothetical protein
VVKVRIAADCYGGLDPFGVTMGCVAICKLRACDGTIPRTTIPTKCLDSRDSSVGIAVVYGLDDRSSIPERVRIFSFS